MRFSGHVDVENSEFDLEFKELIVRPSEIAFELKGYDEFGEFRADGTAAKLSGGGFSAVAVARYEGFPPEDDRTEFSLLLDEVEVSDAGTVCRVAGKWIERPDRWSFSGELEKA
ncbi:hypothetical protein [Thioalkalivibrio sp. ALE14]|uniref:hypothetical protein n=1 Tax=Thioalkalivibrio sp. ALE14 TaxID=1158168 RepID=UPI0009D94200|nr:hypothetical protein [Thioalkalivibrio sp. ALE14]